MHKLNNRNLPNEWSGDLNWVSTKSKQTITNFVYCVGHRCKGLNQGFASSMQNSWSYSFKSPEIK